MKFTKMHGCGNDYIYINCFEENVEKPEALAKRLSSRHFGIGSDGLILIAPSDIADVKMIMYNADGSEAEMCGNGIRCLAKYAYDHGIKRDNIINVETRAGIKAITVFVKNGHVNSARVNMGKPFLKARDIPVLIKKDLVVQEPLKINDRTFIITAVGMGNPHCIVYVESVADFDVCKWGPAIENHDIFPKKTNVEFVEVRSPSQVKQRTWERGSGETLACGTGASAVCVAGVLTGKTEKKLENQLRGGTLTLEWEHDDSPVFMTGPCVQTFTGEIHV